MKTATYRGLDGQTFSVDYDETAPCLVCQESVGEASMGGTAICPACDVGRCRYCAVLLPALREEIDGGASLRNLRAHIAWHKNVQEG